MVSSQQITTLQVLFDSPKTLLEVASELEIHPSRARQRLRRLTETHLCELSGDRYILTSTGLSTIESQSSLKKTRKGQIELKVGTRLPVMGTWFEVTSISEKSVLLSPLPSARSLSLTHKHLSLI